MKKTTKKNHSDLLAAIEAASAETKSTMAEVDAMIAKLGRKAVWANVMALEGIRDEMKEIREDLKARLELDA